MLKVKLQKVFLFFGLHCVKIKLHCVKIKQTSFVTCDKTNRALVTNTQSYPIWNVNMWKSATLVSPHVFNNVLCLRDKSWRFGKHHLKNYNWCGRSFQVQKLSNDNIWSVVIVTKTCFMSQLRVFGPRTNTMSCWQKTPLLYNTSNHFYHANKSLW